MIKFIFLLTIFLISIASLSFIITQPLIFLILIPLIGVLIILFTDLSKINETNYVTNTSAEITSTGYVSNVKKLITLTLISIIKPLTEPSVISGTSVYLRRSSQSNTQNSIFFIIALFFSLLNLFISMVM